VDLRIDAGFLADGVVLAAPFFREGVVVSLSSHDLRDNLVCSGGKRDIREREVQ
jgi:hypothetical protein